MTDIELVIKIPERAYGNCKREFYNLGEHGVMGECEYAIANGTPLPKGHGELIDRDKIEYLKAIHDAKYGHISWIDAIEKIKHSAPTIIEAYRAERSDKE